MGLHSPNFSTRAAATVVRTNEIAADFDLRGNGSTEAHGSLNAELAYSSFNAAMQSRQYRRKQRHILVEIITLERRAFIDQAKARIDRTVENLTESLLKQFVEIAEARIRSRAERQARIKLR
jgi:hypothetical protein